MKTRVMQDEPDKPVVHEPARRPAGDWAEQPRLEDGPLGA